MKLLLTFLFTLAVFVQPGLTFEVYKSKAGKLDVYGDVSVAILAGKQDVVDAGTPSTGQIRGDGRIGINAAAFLKNSYKVGLFAELEISATFEDYHIYLSGPFGELKLGQTDNASVFLHLYHPEFLAPGIDTVDWSDFQFAARSSVGGGPQIGDSTFLLYDDLAYTLTYLSPSIQGFQFGASWTPDPCASFDNSHNSNINNSRPIGDDCSAGLESSYTIQNVVTFATQFSRKESFGLAWGVSAGYLFGERATATNTPYAYNLGVNLSFDNFELGGSWQNSRNLNAADLEDKVWTVGIAYSKDNWKIGGAYRQSRRDDDPKIADKTNREIEVGLAYELGKGLWTSISFEYVVDRDLTATPTNWKSYGGGLILTYQF